MKRKIKVKITPGSKKSTNLSYGWLQIYEGVDGTQYCYIGPLLSAWAGTSWGWLEADCDSKPNKYGQIRIRNAKHIPNPAECVVPEEFIELISKSCLPGDILLRISKHGYEHSYREQYIAEIENLISHSENDPRGRKQLLRLQNWICTKAYQVVEWPLRDAEGNINYYTLKIRYNGTVAVETGNFRPVHHNSKGTYVNINQKRHFLPENDLL
jgi:hypothetical protein